MAGAFAFGATSGKRAAAFLCPCRHRAVTTGRRSRAIPPPTPGPDTRHRIRDACCLLPASPVLAQGLGPASQPAYKRGHRQSGPAGRYSSPKTKRRHPFGCRRFDQAESDAGLHPRQIRTCGEHQPQRRTGCTNLGSYRSPNHLGCRFDPTTRPGSNRPCSSCTTR